MTLQGDKTIYGEDFKPGEHTVKDAYLNSMKHNTNCYWEPENNQHVALVSTQTMLLPCLDLLVVTDVEYIPIFFK